MAIDRKMSLFADDEGSRIFEKLSTHYQIVAPVNKTKQGHLSDTDV